MSQNIYLVLQKWAYIKMIWKFSYKTFYIRTRKSMDYAFPPNSDILLVSSEDVRELQDLSILYGLSQVSRLSFS